MGWAPIKLSMSVYLKHIDSNVDDSRHEDI